MVMSLLSPGYGKYKNNNDLILLAIELKFCPKCFHQVDRLVSHDQYQIKPNEFINLIRNVTIALLWIMDSYSDKCHTYIT